MNTSSLCHMILSSINTPTVLLSKYADPNSTTPKKHLMDDSEFIRDMTDLGGMQHDA